VCVTGCATKTVTVTAPVKAPPPSAQTLLAASLSAGEEGDVVAPVGGRRLTRA
jgi:hypothetical protein